jgi:N6-adenosine-specific RNA methylase IME4
METKTYDIIITDPPWNYYGSTDGMGDAAKHYSLMYDEDICKIKYPLSEKSILLVWATSPKLEVAMQAIQRHGLHFRGVAFVWVKTSRKGEPIGAQGVRPSITKPLTEFVLAASKTPKGRPLPLSSESICQTVFAMRGEHSQKPEEIQDRLEQMYPSATKAEFFARRHRANWDCFGGELKNWNAEQNIK